MTAFAHVFSLALLHFLWQGTAAAILLWIALFAMRKRSANARYLVSCAALAVLILLPAATVYLLYQGPSPVQGVELAAPQQPGSSALPARTTNWLNSLQTSFQVWAVPVWCLGVLIFSARLVWGSRQVSLIRRRGEPAEEALHALVAGIAARMGVTKNIGVLISALVDGPSVVGFLRPVILLPAATVLGLAPEQLEAVLAHELAHIRRYDYLVNVVELLAEALLFFHPAVWWISGRIRCERELCCDDEAVRACGDAFRYARALAALERMRVMTPSLALGGTDGPLAYRINRLMGVTPQDHLPSKLPGLAALCLALACLGVSVNRIHAQAQPDAAGVRVDLGSSAVIHRAPVAYPAAAQISNIRGTVSVELHLDASGNVSDARVLSGPEELRKPVLQSVLGWHFTPDAAGATRVVNVEFQAPSQEEPRAIAVLRDTPNREDRPGQTVSPTQSLKAELAQLQSLEQSLGGNTDREAEMRAALAELQAKMAAVQAASAAAGATIPPDRALQLDETARFLKAQLDQAKANLAQAQALNQDPDSIKSREIRAALAALEMKVRDTQVRNSLPAIPEAPVFLVTVPTRSEPMILPPPMARQYEGRILRNLRLVGISMSTEDFLAQAQLPIRVGDTLTKSSIEAAIAAVKKFDDHLAERWSPVEPNGMDVTIFAPGAGAGIGAGAGAGVGGGMGGGIGPGDGRQGGTSPPRVVYRTQPEYTDEAKKANWQGSVVLSLIVDETGKPTDIKVKKSLGLGLDGKAIEAVEKWLFSPGMKDGKPVPVAATVEVNFRL